MVANIPGAIIGTDPEFLHQLRVGMRRLRAALHAFDSTMRREDVRALRRALRRVARVAGPARDWDVFTRRLPASLQPAAGRQRRAAHAQLKRVLRAPQLWLLPRGVPAPRQSLTAFAQAGLEQIDRKAQRMGARIDWARPGQRHALRVRLRRLRYVCEFLHGVFPQDDSEPLIRGLKRLQDLLGDLNDLEIARRLRAKLPGKPRRGNPKHAKLLAQLPAAWRAFTAAPRFWRDK